MWNAYQNGKQTIRQLSEQTHLSVSSIKRRLRKIERVWTQPDLTGKTGYIHLDVTYWGVMLALDDTTNKLLYVAFVKSETTQDYRTAIDTITAAGYTIKGSMRQIAGWFLCISLIYSIFVAFKTPKNTANEQEKVPSVRGGQNKENG